jgi:hypothetical protein
VTYLAQLLIFVGGAWCGAVLSQVFGHGESVRWFAALAMSPALASAFLGIADANSRFRLRAALLALWLGVMLFCAALATTDLVKFSVEGRRNRALAVLAFAATISELRRLVLAARASKPVSTELPYPTTLPFPSFDEAVRSQAQVLGVSRKVLIERLETAIAKAAPLAYGTGAPFEVSYAEDRQTFDLKVVVPGPEPKDELLFDVYWRLEDREQATAQDAAYGARQGFQTADSNFSAAVDALCREVLGLPALGPLELLREDWLRMLNTLIHTTRTVGLEFALEVVVSTNALPRPLGGLNVFDLVLATKNGPHFNDCRDDPRALETEVMVAGAPLRVGTVHWAELPVSVLGCPDRAALETWATKWLAPAKDKTGEGLSGSIHKVDLMEFASAFELTVDFGSAPLAALEELVVLLRKSGPVSLDHAALMAQRNRTHEGTRDDIVPLVRREGGSLSEHLVGDLWLTYAVESRQSFAGMSPHEAQGLGLDPSHLRAVAIENLRKRLPPVRISGHSGVYMLTLPGEGGFFEASLLLLDEVWDAQLAPHLKGAAVVTMPFRDLVFVTGADDEAGLARVRELEAGTQTQDLEHALSRQFLVRRQGAWRVL